MAEVAEPGRECCRWKRAVVFRDRIQLPIPIHIQFVPPSSLFPLKGAAQIVGMRRRKIECIGIRIRQIEFGGKTGRRDGLRRIRIYRQPGAFSMAQDIRACGETWAINCEGCAGPLPRYVGPAR